MKVSNVRVDEITEMYGAFLVDGYMTLIRIEFEHDVVFPEFGDEYDKATELYYDDFDYSVFSGYVGVDLNIAENFEADWRGPNELWLSINPIPLYPNVLYISNEVVGWN